jgi:hypothetical protein
MAQAEPSLYRYGRRLRKLSTLTIRNAQATVAAADLGVVFDSQLTGLGRRQ